MKYEYKIDVSGTEYFEDEVIYCSINRALFEKFSAGNACAATLELEIVPKAEIPRMAVITPYAKEIGSNTWNQLGVFYVDTNESDGYTTKLVAYDAMLKSEVIYMPPGAVGTWPKTMQYVAENIASTMGVSIDARTSIPPTYETKYPNQYSCRELLCDIAAACGGNWTITAENKLLLVPLFSSMPSETSLLIDDVGRALKFPDGTRISL